MSKETHDKYLDELVWKLSEIGEDLREIKWIMKDGIWLRDRSIDYHKMCDLLLAYPDHIIPVELKGSRNKVRSAREQIQSGAEFAREVLGYKVPYGKFVVYSSNGYHTEKIQI